MQNYEAMKDPQSRKRRLPARTTRPVKPTIAVGMYREDPLYPRIRRVVAEILQDGNVVAPVDVLVRTDLLAPEHLDDWLNGRVPYLEKVIRCNLTKLSRLLRILRFHTHDLNLVPSIFTYRCQSENWKQRLRFTKTGAPSSRRLTRATTFGRGSRPFTRPCRSEEDEPRTIPLLRAGRPGLRFRTHLEAFGSLPKGFWRPLEGLNSPPNLHGSRIFTGFWHFYPSPLFILTAQKNPRAPGLRHEGPEIWTPMPP